LPGVPIPAPRVSCLRYRFARSRFSDDRLLCPLACRGVYGTLYRRADLKQEGASMAMYQLRVNGKTSSVDSWDPDQPLLYVLRNALGLQAAKFGCGLGQCGACMVWIDGKAAPACVTTVKQAAGRA